MRSVDERLHGDSDAELMNHLRTLALFERAFDYPGFIPAYIRPSSAKAKGLSAGPPFQVTRRT